MHIASVLLAFLLAGLVSGCGDSPPGVVLARVIDGIRVQDHFFEVPRTPHPGYHRDGVQVQGVSDERWTAACVRAGDVVASVNGTSTWNSEEFAAAVGEARSHRIRVRGERLGAYGTHLVDVELVP